MTVPSQRMIEIQQRDNDPFDRQRSLGDLYEELYETQDTVIDLLDELDAMEILREHVPAPRRLSLDRLETAIRLIDRLYRNIDRHAAQLAAN